jgi:predicted enzyme related to lactoylglutathione lyase
MPRPTHFEIPVENPERAIAFYQKVFGWTFQKWDGGAIPYWLITTGPDSEPGINGGLLPRQHSNQPCVNTIAVKDVDAVTANVTKNGGRVTVPKMAIPGVGWLAYCADLDGHVFGVMQADEKAA